MTATAIPPSTRRHRQHTEHAARATDHAAQNVNEPPVSLADALQADALGAGRAFAALWAHAAEVAAGAPENGRRILELAQTAGIIATDIAARWADLAARARTVRDGAGVEEAFNTVDAELLALKHKLRALRKNIPDAQALVSRTLRAQYAEKRTGDGATRARVAWEKAEAALAKLVADERVATVDFHNVRQRWSVASRALQALRAAVPPELASLN